MLLGFADMQEGGPASRVDAWLRFDPRVEERYEADTQLERAAALKYDIWAGLVFYNAYNVTGSLLMPDISTLGLAARIGLVTPVSLLLAYLVGRVGSLWRERLILNGMIGAIAVPIFLFWLTRAPLGAFTFGEFPLTLVFGNMVLALRFRHAVVFSLAACGAAGLAVLSKSSLPEALQFAFLVQFLTAAAFTLYANYRMEKRRCDTYLAALTARLRSDAAEQKAELLNDISETDALTGLPNRRLLDRRLAEWFEGSQSIALMMIDVDHFKLFNDVLGHPSGDDCLRRVAVALAEATGPEEALVARYGGEEFTVALHGVPPLQAARTAAALVKSVEELGVEHPGRVDGLGLVTISAGVALRAEGAPSNPAALFAAADAALYEAKRRGRNRYIFADSRGGGLLAGA